MTPQSEVPRSARGGSITHKEWLIAGVVGGSYLGLTLLRPWVRSAMFGYDGPVTAEVLGASPIAYFGPGLLAVLVPFCIVLAAKYGKWLPSLTETGDTDISIAGTTAVVALGSYILAVLGLWPFRWQHLQPGAVVVSCWAKREGMALAQVAWLLQVTVLAAVVEEWLFRRWIPMLLLAMRAPTPLAIVTSSALFALGHLGTVGASSFNQANILQMSWLFLGAVVLSYGTMVRGWRLSGSIAAHGTRNFTDLTLLFLAKCPT